MSYSNQTINNKSSIKRFTHIGRFNVALALLDFKKTDTLLDFGTGDGHMLQLINQTISIKKLIGYEPVSEMYDELVKNINQNESNSIQVINNLKAVSTLQFNYVTCFEVLEHFSKENQDKHIKDIIKLTSNDGTIIISVPLEIGLTALFKNSIRFLLGQKHSNTNLKTISKAMLGLKDSRTQAGYINSHVGFNHNDLECVFKDNNLRIIKKQYSPFKYLYGLLNSQIFYVLKKV